MGEVVERQIKPLTGLRREQPRARGRTAAATGEQRVGEVTV